MFSSRIALIEPPRRKVNRWALREIILRKRRQINVPTGPAGASRKAG